MTTRPESSTASDEQAVRPIPADMPSTARDQDTRLGDRGDAAGRNIEQSRAIGQDDPIEEGSRMGRERDKDVGFPGTPDIGTDALQTEEADRADDHPSRAA